MWHLLTLITCHLVMLISIKSAPVLSTSGDNFREENGKKIGQSNFSAENIYRCMLLFLIIFSTIEPASFAMRFARHKLCLLWMTTETHRVHTDIQKLPFVRFSQDMKAIKIIFQDLLTLLINFYIKKKTKRKAVVGKRNIHVKCVLVNTSVIRYFYVPFFFWQNQHESQLGQPYWNLKYSKE